MGCYDEWASEQKVCPTCRHPVDQKKLVRNRPLEGILARMRVHCEHAESGKGDEAAAQRAKLPLASSMTDEAIMKELWQRGLDSTGIRPALVARLVEGRQQDIGCPWTGSLGDLPGHMGKCGWVPVKCPNEGCALSPLRKDLLEHKTMSCETRVNPQPKTRNPQPSTRNPQPETRNPKPETQNSKPETRNPKPESFNPQRETRNQSNRNQTLEISQSGTRNPKQVKSKPDTRNQTIKCSHCASEMTPAAIEEHEGYAPSSDIISHAVLIEWFWKVNPPINRQPIVYHS